MDLIGIIKQYKSRIMDEGLLIEYGLFFENMLKQHCTFVLDNDNSIGILNNVLLRIKESDKNAEIYVNTYGIDFTKENLYIYADTLWINTIIGKEKIIGFFNGFPEAEPSDILSLDKDEMADGAVALVVLAGYKVESYKTFIGKRELSKIKSLYWD